MEGGILLLALVVISGITVFHHGMTGKAYGFCGAMIALAVFALSSYPMQVLPFGIALVIFGVACVVACSDGGEYICNTVDCKDLYMWTN